MNLFEDLIPGGSPSPFEDLVPSSDPFGGRLNAMSGRVGAMSPSWASDPAPSAPLSTPFEDLIPTPGPVGTSVMPGLTQALDEGVPDFTRGRATGFEDPRSWLNPQAPDLSLDGTFDDLLPPDPLAEHWSAATGREIQGIQQAGQAGVVYPGGVLDAAGDAVTSGAAMLQQGAQSIGAQLAGRALSVINRIDAGEPVGEMEDPIGYLQMSPDQRRSARAELEGQLGESVWRQRALGQEMAGTPMPSAMRAIGEATTFGEAWDAFMTDPFGVIGFAGLQSMVASSPSIATGLAGRAVGGLSGLAAGTGLGSAGVEFGASIVDALQEGGVNLSDSQAVASALTDQAFMEGVRQRAAARAGAIGTLDAAGARLAGVAMRPGSVGGRVGAMMEAGPQFATQAATGMAGEALGQALTGEYKPGDILLEGVAEGFTTPLDVVLARGGRFEGAPPAAPGPAGTGLAAGPGGVEPPPLDVARALPDGAIELPPISVTAPDMQDVQPVGPDFSQVLPPDLAAPVAPESVQPVGPELVQPVSPEMLAPTVPLEEFAPAPPELFQAAPAPQAGDVSRETMAAPPAIGARVVVDFGDGEVETGVVDRVTPFEEDGQQRYNFLLRTDDGRGIDSRDDDVTIAMEGEANVPLDALDLDAPVTPMVPPTGPAAPELSPDVGRPAAGDGAAAPGGADRQPGTAESEPLPVPLPAGTRPLPTDGPGGVGPAVLPAGDGGPAPAPLPLVPPVEQPAPAPAAAPVAPGLPSTAPAGVAPRTPDALAPQAPPPGPIPQALPQAPGTAGPEPALRPAEAVQPLATQPDADWRIGDPPTTAAQLHQQLAKVRRSLPVPNGNTYRIERGPSGGWRVIYRPGDNSDARVLGPTTGFTAQAEAVNAAVEHAFPPPSVSAAPMPAPAEPAPTPTETAQESVSSEPGGTPEEASDGTEPLRATVPAPPEAVPAVDVPPAAGQPEAGPAPDGDRRERPGDEGRAAAPDGGERSAPAERPLPGASPASDSPGDGGRGDGAGRPDPGAERRGRAEPDAADAGRGDGPALAGDRPSDADQPSGADRNADASVRGENFRLDPEAIGRGGDKAKARGNIKAIRLLKKIEAEGRPADREEQAVLAQYVGWGGLPQVFRDSTGQHRPEWKEIGEQIEALLSADELAAARLSTINAHYTSPEVIAAMWRALAAMGFRGGRVLEPSMGVGHFFGLMPPEMAGRSRLSGVELDLITGGIARLLYPKADVRVTGFENVPYAGGFFDLVIGNVPFSSAIKPYDPEHNKRGRVLHDYFFAKSLAVTKPGGLLVLITSKGTLDKRASDFRAELASQADLVGSVRLPNTAFKGNAGTEVVTDLVVLRKRGPGQAPQPVEWMGLEPVAPDGIPVNEYYARNPQQMLGTMRLTGSMYGANEPTLEPSTDRPLADQIDEALGNVARNLGQPLPSPESGIAPAEAVAASEYAPRHVKPGAYYLDDKGVIRQSVRLMAFEPTIPKSRVDRVKALIGLRDAARAVLDVQRADGPDADQRASRKALGDAYDAFVRKWGPVNRETRSERPHPNKPGEVIVTRQLPNMSSFDDDPDAALVRALEHYDAETDTATKADIFTKRVLDPNRGVREIATPNDALLAAITDRGHVDLPWMAERLGLPEGEVIAALKGLIFRDPATNRWVDSDEYLSGNVRRKLKEAQAAAARDDAFQANVRALEENQPEDIPPSKISVGFGAPWIKPAVIEEFSRGVLGARPKVRHREVDATWRIDTAGLSWNALNSAAVTVDYGTPEFTAFDLMGMALNQRMPEVAHTDRDGKRIVDATKTAAAQEKQQRLKDEFARWMWVDEQRADEQARAYNDQMNNTRLRTFDGSHLTFPGMSASVTLRRHQKDGVWRILRSGNTLLAHVVGAGKTMTMIAAAMEGRRIGLVRKPMIVVPNHMLEQFSREFLQLYPGANIMVADKEDLHTSRRRAFVNRVATNDWDAVVVTHSTFGKIGMSAEFQAEFLREQINEYDTVLREAKKEGDRTTVKNLEATLKAMEERLKKMMAADKKDRGVVFEDLGVDHITVDEAHYGKNLLIATKMKRIKGLATSSSERALDLYLKTQYLDRLNPGRSVVFATATPISNTIAEMFTMQRYLQPRALKERGLHAFDAWAATFGETVTALEATAAGSGYEMVTAFARYRNVGELAVMFRDVADVKLARDLNLPTPTLRTGGPQIIAARPSAAQLAAIQDLVRRLSAVKGKKSEQGGDNALVVISDGRKIALDMRLFDPAADDFPGSKVNLAIDRMFNIWQHTKDRRSTQIIFSDVGTPGGNKPFNVYDEVKRKLVSRGVPAKEVVFVHSADNDEKKARLFADVRAGRVRFLLGSTEKMGVGTNVQTRLVAKHDLDAPWRPADVEQRDGRIIRQGNENPEIDIYRYVTEGSFDVFMWQTLERKARGIADIMTADASTRETEDVGDVTIDYATAKALASGDPLVFEQVGIENDIQRLERLERAHRDEQQRIRSELRQIDIDLPNDEKRAAAARADMGAAATLPKDKEFRASLDGRDYTDKKAFGEALQQRMLDVADPPRPGTVLGRYGGFDIEAGDQSARHPGKMADARLVGQHFYSFVVEAEYGGRTIADRMVAQSTAPEKLARRSEENIADGTKKKRDLEAKRGQPFRDAALLEQKRARLDEIRETMRQSDAADASQEEGGGSAMFADLGGPDRPLTSLSGMPPGVAIEEAADDAIAVHWLKDDYARNVAAWGNHLQTIVDDVLGPDRVELRVAAQIYSRAEGIPETEAGGYYHRTANLIYASLAADSPERIARHESMHAAWSLGLFTEQEKDAMRAATADDPKWQAVARQLQADPLYARLRPDDVAEEVSAYRFEMHRQGRPTGIRLIDDAFNRLARLYDAIRAFLRRELGVTPDWRDLFSEVQRGGLRDRPGGSIAQQAVDEAGDGALARIREDRIQAETMAAPLNEIEVDERPAIADMNVLARNILRPIEAFRRWPPLRRLVEKGIAAEQRMSNHINRLNKQFDRIVDKLSRTEFEELGAVLFQGDAEEHSFTRDELATMDVSPKVAAAYIATRDLIETVGRYVDQHRRSMMPEVQARKAAVLRRMSRLTNMTDPEFRRLYGRRARLRERLRAGAGDPQAIAAELDRIEEGLNQIREDLPAYLELQAEADRLEARLASTSVRRREGYVPHKFFGTWRVFVRSGADADGNPVWAFVAGDHGFFPGRQAAIGAARAYLERNPGAELRVAPVEFKFPESDATQLSDRAYQRFVGRVADQLELSGQELRDAIGGVARQRFRRRIAGFARYRSGVQGFSKNIDRVLRSHIGEAVRYVAMDRLKFDAINTMEAMGLSPARRENQETAVLQAAINAWFRDVNGQKQPVERSIDIWLDKLEASPAYPALGVGAAIAAGIGIAGSAPIMGTVLGSYVGYRLYRSITSGGEFKTRALTGAALGDMAHLKLGAFLNVFSALVNLSQLAIATYPVLGEKWTMVGMTKAMAALVSARTKNPGPDVRLLERADIDPRFSYAEASPHLFNKQSKAAKWSLFLFSSAETVNRSVTFLGAYHRAIGRGASPAAAMAEAKGIVTRTQFHYGAANKPELLRNVLLRVPLQFKNFAVNIFSFMFGLRGAELGRFLVAMLLVSGLFGLPGWEWLDWMLEAATGVSMRREVVRAALKLQGEGRGQGSIVDTLARGFPALLGMDLSARTGMGDLLPNEQRDFQGPWAGTLANMIRLGQTNATLVDQARNLSPGLGNPLKALEAAADGIPLELALWRAAGLGEGPTGFGNGRAIASNPWKRGYYDYEPTDGELFLRAMGGRPLREAHIQGYEEIKRKDTEELRKSETRYLDRIIMALREEGSNPESVAFKRKSEAILKEAAADKSVSLSRVQVQNAIRNALQDRGARGLKTAPREIRGPLDELRRSAYGVSSPTTPAAP